MKISFLVGAGAETKDNFFMPEGFDYTKQTLFLKEYHPKMLDALASFNKRVPKNNDTFSPKYCRYTFDASGEILRHLIVNKANSDSEYLNEHRLFIRYALETSDLLSITGIDVKTEKRISYKEYTSDNLENVKDLKEAIKRIYSGEIKYHDELPYELKALFKERKPKDNDDYDKNGNIDKSITDISVGSELANYFHTIVNPVKYGIINFFRLYNYYWACYFTIVKSILLYFRRYVDNNAFEEYIDGEELNYLAILNNLKPFTVQLYDYLSRIDEAMLKRTYYGEIKNRLSKDFALNSVITTNYFGFVQLLSKDAIYLNGKLNQFEKIKACEVFDLNSSDEVPENEYFIPFIFGNTPTKPIVSPYQTEEYHKFFKSLKTADTLVVLGYGVNEDDNHINTFLHEYAKKNKHRLIYVTNKSDDVYNKLNLDSEDEITLCVVDYGEKKKEIVRNIFDTIKCVKHKRRQ